MSEMPEIFNGSKYLGLWKPHIQFRENRWSAHSGTNWIYLSAAHKWCRIRNEALLEAERNAGPYRQGEVSPPF